ncbi:Citrate synthase 4, mitochondrial [Dichanthelium oligosanthes]|uniref:Citrate synthase n=1 Tax=Dichanthelium oligosanthes TaxID=888268 RepID=A0A1E5WLJ7_9POAL|nr:Citrate synthase 4, mitochondrial [Dichanthelium oligosanthes]
MAFFRGLTAVSRLRSRMAQEATTLGGVRWLQMQSASDLDLRSQLQELIPEQQDRLKKLKSEHGKVQLGNITVDMVLGGMRGMTGMLWETSLLDPEEGIRFRGLSIPECQQVLPTAVKGGEPLPEGLLWLLLTGKVPTKEQVDALSKELLSRSSVPAHVYKAIDALPVTAHPMTQFTTGVMALQVESEFQKAYDKGMPKSKFWEPTYEDVLNLIARLPPVASYVYRRIFKDGKSIEADNALDYAANFSHMLGFDDPKMLELMRLYVTIHTDHEGGNVSAHTGHLEVLLWIKSVIEETGSDVTTDQLKDYVWKTLKSGKVVPGFGHGVLRKTDPRYSCQREFALKHLPEDPLFQLVSKLYEVVPPILTELGKVKNPWPNVDAHSGVLLNHFGLSEARYYTVLFGVSRSIGIGSQLIWDRALGLPLERPKSVTMEWLENYCKNKAA